MRCSVLLSIKAVVLMSTDVSTSRFKAARWVAIASMVPAIPFCFILALLLPLIPEITYCLPHDLFCDESSVQYAESVPQTSATILGLTNFAFLLGIRFNKPQIDIQYHYVGIAFISICVVTILQMILIMYTQGDMLSLRFYWYAMGATAIALVVVGFSLVQIVTAGSRVGEKDIKHVDSLDDDAKNSQYSGLG